ncbi:hypothetical protein [Chromobacterium vaccinii]|uniref:hypothetical protein n=1 Tax=Chromobacterium vaccinii TaxID=1108595 RepID=UPI000E19F810|nr:hypothetical protein [Chromobacterium vaccinii]SUX30173.1 Uncharacterised protein [Chromobacterium vaccinii]
MKKPTRRSPAGLQSDKPVAVRFTEDEKAELLELSRKEYRTMSSMVRIIYLLGLEQFKDSRGMK